MSKSFIKFGSINKKFLLPFLLAVSEVAYIIFNKYYPVKDVNLILHVYSMAFGEMSIKLLPYILKISDNDIIQRNKRLTTKRKCLHYTILSLLYVFTLGINGGADAYEAHVMGKKISIAGSNLFSSNDLILLGLEMIFMIVVSIWLLKYKYYKHHIISTIVFVIFGIISELCLGTYFQNDGKFFLNKFIRLVAAAFDATYYCYQKYMMEKFYYPYWNIAFTPGILIFINASMILIIVLSSKQGNDTSKFSFYLYFKVKEGLGLPILKVVIDLIFHLIMCPLIILNVFYFSPNFILIIFQFSAIAKNIMNHNVEKLYCIVFYSIQFFALMIHLEILELSFCGLNKYTKKNIDLRSRDDLIFERRDSISRQDSIEIESGYNLEAVENDDKIIELKEQGSVPVNE